MTKHSINLVAIALLLGLTPLHSRAEGPTISEYLVCYRHLAAAPSMEPELWVRDGMTDIVVVPERRHGKAGMYVFTKDMAYFHAYEDISKLGPKRSFELTLPGHRPIYLALTERTFTTPALLESSAEPLAFKFQKLEGGDAMDGESRKAMSWELRRRMSNLTSAYEFRMKVIEGEEKKLRTDLSIGAKSKLEKLAQLRVQTKERVEKALDSCMLKEDFLLRGAVSQEREEWRRVRPPVLAGDVCPNCHAGSDASKAN